MYRDIGGSDPERMAAPRVEEYITKLFGDSSPVKVSSFLNIVKPFVLGTLGFY